MDTVNGCDALENPFKCTVEGCTASFKKKRKLTNHERLHIGERPFACDVEGCTKKYTNSSHLARHKNTFHSKQQKKPVPCTFEGCELLLSDTVTLMKHIAAKHNPDRVYRYMCTECDMGFSKKNQLQSHSYVHTGVLHWKCQTCGMRFENMHNLGRHQRTHTVYTCNCKKQFERWSLLLAHRRSCESMKKEFKCEVCSQKLSSNRNLKQHMLTHKSDADKTIFVCPHDNCGRGYLYKRNLKLHIQSVHENVKKRIPCPIENCNVTLSRMRLLTAHLRVHNEGVKSPLIRKPRKDKGIPRIPIADKLCGISKRNKDNEMSDSSESSISSMELGEMDEEIVSTTDDELTSKVDTPENNVSLHNNERAINCNDSRVRKRLEVTTKIINEAMVESMQKLEQNKHDNYNSLSPLDCSNVDIEEVDSDSCNRHRYDSTTTVVQDTEVCPLKNNAELTQIERLR